MIEGDRIIYMGNVLNVGFKFMRLFSLIYIAFLMAATTILHLNITSKGLHGIL